MPVTPAQSARNADARTFLALLYSHSRARDGRPQVVALGKGQDFHGMPTSSAIEAALRLVDRRLLRSHGATLAGPMVSLSRAGIDAHESPDVLDQILPVLRDTPVVDAPTSRSPSEEVAAALRDADAAIGRGEPENAVDRVHTALHTRIREICAEHSIALDPNESLVGSFAALWKQHPDGPTGHKKAERVMHNLGAALEALNELRNNVSLAHGRGLLDRTDATLAINATRTVAQYVEARFTTKK